MGSVVTFPYILWQQASVSLNDNSYERKQLERSTCTRTNSCVEMLSLSNIEAADILLHS